MKKIFLIPFLSFTFTSNAYAADCSDKKNGTEINKCLAQELKAADQELNTIYQLLVRSDQLHKKQLADAELAWIKFRDLEAKFQSLSYDGGTESNREYTRTLIKLTKELTDHLKYALDKMGE